MTNTTFYKKDGNVSSRRSTFKLGNDKINMTSYSGSNKGGITFDGKFALTRLDKNMRLVGFGIKNGNSITYFGSNFRPISNISSFR